MAGGQYVEVSGICRKVDAEVRQIIQVDEMVIPLKDVYEIADAVPEGKLFLYDEWDEAACV